MDNCHETPSWAAFLFMKYVLLLFATLAFTGCATRQSVPLTISGETALIRGHITNETAQSFTEALSGQRISRVLLDSSGGLVEPALGIARQIRDRQLDVEVIGNCFSSCANYIFPAGRNKSISGLGIVAWHGNIHHLLYLHGTGQRLLPEQDLPHLKNLAAQEDEFCASIGVDGYICWFAKVEPYKVQNLYFLSPEDMARFGLKNVAVRPDYGLSDLAPYNAGAENLRFVTSAP